MKTVLCDKCKGLVVKKTGINFSAKEPLTQYSIDEFDLCIDCVKLLLNWLKEKPTGK